MPTFSNALFLAAWWMLAVVAAAGILSLIVGFRRSDNKLRRLGIVLILIAGIVAGLRLLFPTEREKMELRSRHLVEAVNRQDWSSVAKLLNADTIVSNITGGESRTMAAGRDAIIASVRANWDSFSLKSVHVIGIESEQDETLITVSLEVYSVQDATEGEPMLTTWQLSYQQSGDQWILERITLVRIGRNGEENYSF